MSGRRSDEAALLASKHGFEDTYSLSGGLREWHGPIQPFMNNHSPWVHTLFDTDTETAQYLVTDLGKLHNMATLNSSFQLSICFFSRRDKGSIYH